MPAALILFLLFTYFIALLTSAADDEAGKAYKATIFSLLGQKN